MPVGLVWPISRRGILSGIGDLEAAPRLNAHDLYKSLAAGAFQLLNDHGHGCYDRADGQRETAHSLHALGVADVMQPRLLDRSTLVRVVELGTISRD